MIRSIAEWMNRDVFAPATPPKQELPIMPGTFKDLIGSIGTDAASVQADQDKIAALNAQFTTDSKSATDKLAVDQAQQKTDQTSLGTGIGATGPIFDVLADGTANVYEPDGSGGVVVKLAKPSSTPLPS